MHSLYTQGQFHSTNRLPLGTVASLIDFPFVSIVKALLLSHYANFTIIAVAHLHVLGFYNNLVLDNKF